MSGPASTAQWYLARGGEQFGPISDAEMARFVELGHLKPNDLLWREGFPDWRPAMVVFPPHPRPQPGGPRGPRDMPMGRPDMAPPPARGHPAMDQPGMGHPGTGRPDMGRPRMMGEPLDSLAAHERAGYSAAEEEPPRRKSVLGRIARLLAIVAVLAAAAGAGYVYRAQLQALLVSLTESSPSGPPIAERRSLDLPPLAGFHAGSAEAVNAALQSTALWKVIKREFPDWYGARIAEAVQLAQEGKDDAVIGHLMGRKLADLRRQHGGSGIAATAERLKSLAVAHLDNLKRLRAHSTEACAGFIRKGEAEPLIVPMLQQGTDLTAALQTQLVAAFEAIGEGRQTPRVHIRPTGDHHALLESELVKRGWVDADFKLWAGNMAEAPPEKVCQLVHDFFAAQFVLPDPEATTRLLINSVRRVFAAG